jgi:hypothetical protein
MIKKISFIVVAFLMVAQAGFANGSDLFSYDRSALESDFTEIQQLEDYVIANGNLSLAEVQNNSVDVLTGINFEILETASPVGAMFSIEDLDWGSFAWGFCCWPVGFFVVAINDNKSSDQKLSYWIGLGVSVVLGAVGQVAGAFAY